MQDTRVQVRLLYVLAFCDQCCFLLPPLPPSIHAIFMTEFRYNRALYRHELWQHVYILFSPPTPFYFWKVTTKVGQVLQKYFADHGTKLSAKGAGRILSTVLPLLLSKLGDTSMRARKTARESIIGIYTVSVKAGLSKASTLLLQKLKRNVAWREAQGMWISCIMLLLLFFFLKKRLYIYWFYVYFDCSLFSKNPFILTIPGFNFLVAFFQGGLKWFISWWNQLHWRLHNQV